MPQSHLLARAIRVGVGGLLFTSLTGAAARAEPTRSHAKPGKEACQSAYQSAQDREGSGLLVEASQLFTKCSNELCGATLSQACISQSTQLREAMPSVVPLVVDDSGEAVIDVQVKMDGHLIASRLNGRAILVNPGAHEFTFSTSDGEFASRKLTISKGEHNRAISVSYSNNAPEADSAVAGE